MPNTINDFKYAMGAGARASKYLVLFAQPSLIDTVGADLSRAHLLCKGLQIPGKTIGTIDMFCQGRKIPMPGDTQFTNAWTLTFYTTEDHDLRRNFLSWMQAVDNFQANIHSGVPADIMSEMGVAQLDSAGNRTATYTFHNVYPTEVAELSLGSDQQDTVLEFDVTFTYSDWVVGNGEFDAPGNANAPTLNSTAY